MTLAQLFDFITNDGSNIIVVENGQQIYELKYGLPAPYGLCTA